MLTWRLEYLSQSNNSSDCVGVEDRFKFVDDLTILEIVNLVTVGITSLNLKQQIPNDLPMHNQYIPAENLKSQEWLDTINEWTVKQKMMLNTKKTKTMIFKYTDNFQFMTRLRVENEPIGVIDSTNLLGTSISKDLILDLNTASLIKKANARMQLLRKVASFSTPTDDLTINEKKKKWEPEKKKSLKCNLQIQEDCRSHQ